MIEHDSNNREIVQGIKARKIIVLRGPGPGVTLGTSVLHFGQEKQSMLPLPLFFTGTDDAVVEDHLRESRSYLSTFENKHVF